MIFYLFGIAPPMRNDIVVAPGNPIKATQNADGSVTLSGLGVVFDEPGTRNRDLTGEYFTREETYYGAAAKSGQVVVDSPFNHHFPLADTPEARALADAFLGQATMTKTEKGWLSELVLPMREKYEEEVAELAEQGKLGWSTGTAGHMYRAAKDGMIQRWPIIEVSLTPTPAEPRTFVRSVKSLAPAPRNDFTALTKALRDLNAQSEYAALTHALRGITA